MLVITTCRQSSSFDYGLGLWQFRFSSALKNWWTGSSSIEPNWYPGSGSLELNWWKYETLSLSSNNQHQFLFQRTSVHQFSSRELELGYRFSSREPEPGYQFGSIELEPVDQFSSREREPVHQFKWTMNWILWTGTVIVLLRVESLVLWSTTFFFRFWHRVESSRIYRQYDRRLVRKKSFDNEHLERKTDRKGRFQNLPGFQWISDASLLLWCENQLEERPIDVLPQQFLQAH